ncbi:carcinoembryonic antigen-related cell adhesion molecule 1 isoform X2 [Dicentrarchus labrax]|uniref:Ig-like domain-containing protein n=1 Tax=Dicentrarchus labrax TaxID=13489 RepID=A0A8P4GS08_DICLA|nr:carcinoembryonic antigen-related cell adhesion molecule 1 isoform X2 [Dicentrarchus labrax]
MECPVLFYFLLATISFETTTAISQNIYASENPLPVGSNVTLFSRINVTTGAWMFNSNIIVMIFPGDRIIDDTWRERVIFNSTTSSLTIRSLQVEDSGLYTLQALNFFRSELTLSVQVPISNVTLRANATNLVEFNDTAVLMCTVANGSSLSYVWLKGNTVVTASGGVQFSDGGATLIIVRVTRYDEGPFRCNVSNGISQEISLPVHLNISYGPSNTTMMIMPMKYIYKTGSNILLSCSAESSPAAIIRWMVNGVYLNDFSPQLQLEMVTESHSGNYQCLFYNTATSRFTSASAMIRILAPIAAVVVNHTGGRALLNEPFTMYCEVNGSVDNIQWWKNGQLISADNTTVFDTGNTTLTLNPVQHSDNGNYQCQAFNYVSNMTSSPYTVKVNYGPMKPVIIGPSMALAGTWVILNCSSASYPPSLISWYFNNSLVATTSKLEIGPLTLNMSGKYACMAFNKITGKNSTASVMLTVLAPVTMVSIKMIGPLPIQNHTFTLICETAGSVESIIWMYNWSQLYPDNTRNFTMNNTILTFDPVMASDNGNYQCVASNPLNSSTSEIFTLEVISPVTMASIEIVGPLPIQNHTFTLICETTGSVESIIWMYYWSPLYPDNTRNFSMDNTILTFDPVMASDNGNYRCVASNPLSSSTSEIFTLQVFYGPEKPTIMGPNMAMTGDNVTLSCYASSNPVSIYKWFFNDSIVANTSEYVTLPLTRDLSGMYTCMAYNNITGKNSTAYTMLTVIDPIMVHVEAPMNPPIEGHFYNLTCNVTGPTEHIYWLKNYEPLHENDRTVFYMNNKTVTFNPLEQTDTGNYQCMSINTVWSITSPPFKLLVNFGPETPIIDGPAFAETGHTAKFSCSAKSVPPSQYHWFFNDSTVANTSVFTTGLLSFNMSGEYTCMASNYVTENVSISVKMLTVIEAIESVMIRNNTVPINSENFTLTCEVNGPYDKIYWMKDNMYLNTSTAKANMSYEIENNTLHFTPVTMYNDGIYQCVATNQAGPHASPQYVLLVNYGPLSVHILGPDSAKVGSSVSLTCSAASQPDCDFDWFLNSQPSAIKTGSVITFPATKENEGNYTCKAKNPVTNITMYEIKAFTVDHASTFHIPSNMMLMVLVALSVTALFN